MFRVGNDMAVAGISVISPVFQNIPKALLPVIRIFLMILHDGPDDPCVFAVCGDKTQGFFQDLFHIVFFIGNADAAGDEDSAVYGISVMGDAGGLLRENSGLFGGSGTDQPPDVNKDLAADLLRHSASILKDGAACGSGNAVHKIEIGGVLGGDPISSPPEKAVLIGGGVHQLMRDVLRGQLLRRGQPVQRPDQKHGHVRIVVSGKIPIGFHIAVDFTVYLPDLGKALALDGSAETHPDRLADPAGVQLVYDLRRD